MGLIQLQSDQCCRADISPFAACRQVVLVLLPFALTVPVGVGIGVALSSVSNWVTLVFFGLIAGEPVLA